jgi:hypothetical protein
MEAVIDHDGQGRDAAKTFQFWNIADSDIPIRRRAA